MGPCVRIHDCLVPGQRIRESQGHRAGRRHGGEIGDAPDEIVAQTILAVLRLSLQDRQDPGRTFVEVKGPPDSIQRPGQPPAVDAGGIQMATVLGLVVQDLPTVFRPPSGRTRSSGTNGRGTAGYRILSRPHTIRDLSSRRRHPATPSASGPRSCAAGRNWSGPEEPYIRSSGRSEWSVSVRVDARHQFVAALHPVRHLALGLRLGLEAPPVPEQGRCAVGLFETLPDRCRHGLEGVAQV